MLQFKVSMSWFNNILAGAAQGGVPRIVQWVLFKLGSSKYHWVEDFHLM